MILAVFENYKIRRHYDEESEFWYFSVVDIIAVLIQLFQLQWLQCSISPADKGKIWMVV
jgi:hypothetical protein